MSSLLSDPLYRIVLAIIAAAVLACAFTIFTATAQQAEIVAPVAGGDQSTGAGCFERGWPYYEAHCVVDLRPQLMPARILRTVTTDRP
ncbi:MAG TPA: hypothetical protein VMH84_05120 [Xanthobacteraceae bacterium]|nr:hypothetical protein [Xanthobacteraceae bacterium]